jgi:hypothetical protein
MRFYETPTYAYDRAQPLHSLVVEPCRGVVKRYLTVFLGIKDQETVGAIAVPRVGYISL